MAEWHPRRSQTRLIRRQGHSQPVTSSVKVAADLTTTCALAQAYSIVQARGHCYAAVQVLATISSESPGFAHWSPRRDGSGFRAYETMMVQLRVGPPQSPRLADGTGIPPVVCQDAEGAECG
jgi:hypothetical protein